MKVSSSLQVLLGHSTQVEAARHRLHKMQNVYLADTLRLPKL